MGIALLVVLLVIMVAARPSTSRRGWGTSAFVGLLALALLAAMILGYIPWTSWDWRVRQ